MDYGVTLALTEQPAALKPGESVSVSVITGEANNALYVPATAVTTTGTTSTVVVVGANNAEQTVPVTLGVQGSTDDQILTGLTAGARRSLTSTATTHHRRRRLRRRRRLPRRRRAWRRLGGGGRRWPAMSGHADDRRPAPWAAPHPVIRLVSVVKVYGAGRGGGAGPARREPGRGGPGLRRDHGRVRLRQVDADEHHRLPGRAHRGPVPDRRHRHRRASTSSSSRWSATARSASCSSRST